MSQVITTKQVESVVQGYLGYALAVQSDWRTYRILESDLPGSIFSRITDAIAQGDSAYRLEEMDMFLDWMDRGYGLDARADRLWERGWKLHKFPPGYLAEHPSPPILVGIDALAGKLPTLPQEPQKRVRGEFNGVRRTIRIKD